MAAAYAIGSLGLSERRSCLLTCVSPSVYRYESKRGDDDALRRRMREIAGERIRFGSPTAHHAEEGRAGGQSQEDRASLLRRGACVAEEEKAQRCGRS
jgi:hypothetical protein